MATRLKPFAAKVPLSRLMNAVPVLPPTIANNTFLRERNTIGFNLGWGEVNAIYLDDQLSQQYIVGNSFVDSDTAVLVNGGRDVVVTGNSFSNCTLGVRYANPGMTVQTACAYEIAVPQHHDPHPCQAFMHLTSQGVPRMRRTRAFSYSSSSTRRTCNRRMRRSTRGSWLPCR